jgi:hypothetical protein
MNTQAITRIIQEKRKCLNAIILLLLISCFVSCQKKNDVPQNNNEVKATVVVSPTSTININATGSKTRMGCANCAGTIVEGTNEANAAVYITVNPPSSSVPNLACVTSTGTYVFDCQYRPNVADPNTPIYGSFGGSMTFIAINDHYMEGSFTTVCRCISQGCAFGVDSVVVTGSFRGDHFN